MDMQASWGYFVLLRLFFPLCIVYPLPFLALHCTAPNASPLAAASRGRYRIRRRRGWQAVWNIYVVLCLLPGDPLAACHEISWRDKAWNMTGEPCSCWALGPEDPFQSFQKQIEPGCDPFLVVLLPTCPFVGAAAPTNVPMRYCCCCPPRSSAQRQT